MVYIYQEALEDKDIKFDIEFSKCKKEQQIESESFILDFISKVEEITTLKEKYIFKDDKSIKNVIFVIDISNLLVKEYYIQFLNDIDTINNKHLFPYINHELMI